MAYSLRGMRPARYAWRPARTACCMASAIRMVCGASNGGIRQTPSAPTHGKRGVRGGAAPASTMSGTSVIFSRRIRRVALVLDSEAAADGRGKRHDGGGSGVDQAARKDNIVEVYGRTVKPSFTSTRVASSVA